MITEEERRKMLISNITTKEERRRRHNIRNNIWYHKNKERISQEKRDRNIPKEFREYIRKLIKDYEEST